MNPDYEHSVIVCGPDAYREYLAHEKLGGRLPWPAPWEAVRLQAAEMRHIFVGHQFDAPQVVQMSHRGMVEARERSEEIAAAQRRSA
ncbi:MAG TPA: hypothetical protein DGD08_08580 [Gemmatimonas aurantiaca]|uniref:Uncharacterized protein n=2 Tax=Gemmatimonas aurantiaca TaxID=173480 RepID=C1A436_GEMAT|nr:hypothetical protein [Gemmatimonas aurantiaca]BAH38861.1 hypothetical protein GAU_1819 [Gemmatimonas aurantiaca T-27]HCT57254.1 hypothetical protein [Gemmatimonas aurantiaca]